MVKWKPCPLCGEIVDEFESRCGNCGYNKVWEKNNKPDKSEDENG
jgi:hypothetical protein